MSNKGRVHIYLLSVIILEHLNQSSPSLHYQAKFAFTSKCIDPSCVFDTFGKTDSPLNCASRCINRETCAAFEYFLSDTKCVSLHRGCLNATICPRSDEDLQVFEKQILLPICQHGGTWDVDLQICKCVDYWLGQFCERSPYSCGELYRYWYAKTGYYNVPVNVYRNGARIVPTVCNIDTDASYTYIMVTKGDLDHNNTWQMYADGYTLNGQNFWLGLENVRAFNKMGHNVVEVWMSLLNKTTSERGIFRYTYTGFNIQDASNGYIITSDTLTKSFRGQSYLRRGYEMADVLGMSQGVPFSAPDLDRDNDADHCASKAGRGWWFDTCNPIKDMNTSINPLGWNYRDHPGFSSMDQYLWIPGVDMMDPSIMETFDMFSVYFSDPLPLRL